MRHRAIPRFGSTPPRSRPRRPPASSSTLCWETPDPSFPVRVERSRDTGRQRFSTSLEPNGDRRLSEMTMTDGDLAAHLADVAGKIPLQVRAPGMFEGKSLGKAGDQHAKTLLFPALRDPRPADGLLPEGA